MGLSRWLWIALFVGLAAAAVAQERKWGEQGSDCPWGSNTCRVQGVGGGTSNSPQSPPAEGSSGCELPAVLPCEL